MTASRTTARHRRLVRSRTPLAVIGDAVSTSGSSVGRRSAVIAASGGLIVTMGLPAVASPLLSGASAPDASATTRSATVEPVVSASASAQVSFALTSLTTVDAAQYSHDAQVAAGERSAVAERASRASNRYQVATKTAGTTTRVVRADDSDDSGDDGSSDSPSTTPTSGAGSGSTGSGTSSSAGTSTPAATSAAVVDVAKRYVGIKYRFGGTTPAGFDCSGFVRYVYGQMGVDLPRTAAQQAASGTRISSSDAKVGDIVSFTGKNGVYHNGIYLGDGKMIDSPRTGKAIDVHDVWSSSVLFTRVA